MKELLPCPFCGGEANIIDDNDLYSQVFVFCLECDCKTADFDLPKQAIIMWNTREGEK